MRGCTPARLAREITRLPLATRLIERSQAASLPFGAWFRCTKRGGRNALFGRELRSENTKTKAVCSFSGAHELAHYRRS